jgi:hypothetical protein
MKFVGLTRERLFGRTLSRNFWRLVVADDGFQRAYGENGTLLTANGEGNGTQCHCEVSLKKLNWAEDSWLWDAPFHKRSRQIRKQPDVLAV